MIETNKQLENTATEEPEKKAVKVNPVKKSLSVFGVCLIGAVASKGWKPFFVGMGVAPALTLAELIGLAFVPFALGWVISKGLSFFLKRVSHQSLWLTSSIALILLSLIGQYRSGS